MLINASRGVRYSLVLVRVGFEGVWSRLRLQQLQRGVRLIAWTGKNPKSLDGKARHADGHLCNRKSLTKPFPTRHVISALFQQLVAFAARACAL